MLKDMASPPSGGVSNVSAGARGACDAPAAAIEGTRAVQSDRSIEDADSDAGRRRHERIRRESNYEARKREQSLWLGHLQWKRRE